MDSELPDAACLFKSKQYAQRFEMKSKADKRV